ncbi:MAG: hypothetical protein H6765_07820 [Candidatus Peribacteria bacterium]|nr:MAG: hypothetical protein H6765_07820 [Candidatus Peribacteria bacterium]
MWYSEYYTVGADLGIITDEDEATLDSMAISRAKMGTWFYLAAMIHAQK